MESPIGWGSWFGVALPVSFISIILIWGLLLLSYHPERCAEGDGEIEIRGIRPTREKFTVEQWWVTFVCIVTIGLWCVEHSIERWVGDMGVIALIPVLAFFSTGVLKKVCGLPYILITSSWFFGSIGRFREVCMDNCVPCNGWYRSWKGSLFVWSA